MMVCPNKKHPDWLNLVAKVGIVESYKQFIANNNVIPNPANVEPNIAGVNHAPKIMAALETDKAAQWFKRFWKTNRDKFYDELTALAGKQQVELLRGLVDSKGQQIEDITSLSLEVATQYGFVVTTDISRKPTTYKHTEYYPEENQYEQVDVEVPREKAELQPNGKYKITLIDAYGDPFVVGIMTKEEAIADFGEYLFNLDPPSQTYSNLTVPGGTNYRENEIATPEITPLIHGHAAFATDKGIGWFRSDEQVKGGKIRFTRDEILMQDPENPLTAPKGYIEGGEQTKTRRILELQSDLFQKGRDLKDIVLQKEGEEGLVIQDPQDNLYFIGDSKLTALTPKFTTLDELFAFAKTDGFKRSEKSRSNSFLQLLNKDNNWVTFFIKTIIQDSAKRGYEKVLFPKGDTASKVEGHETVKGFINQQKRLINDREEDNTKRLLEIEQEEANLEASNDKFKTQAIIDNNKNQIKINNDAIETHKKEIERIEKEGFGALRPIWDFYENKVTKIVKKLYNGVDITDEYGNTWTEVTIVPETHNGTIYYSKKRVQPAYSNQFPIGKDPETKSAKDYEQDYKLRNAVGDYKRFPKTTENVIRLNLQVANINQTLHGTGYRAQTVTQNYRGNTKLIIHIIPDPMFRKETTPVAVDKELNSKIKEWLNKLGIQVKHYESLKAMHGNDPVAVADFLEKIIRISNGEDGLTLPEEAIHFAIELLGDKHPAVSRLLELIVLTPEYAQVKIDYANEYTEELQFRKEAIAKLGADVLFKTKKVEPTVLDLIKKVWADFLAIFKGTNHKDFRNEINYILGKISQDIVNVNIEGYSVENLPEGQMFQLSKEVKTEREILEKAIDNTFVRLRNMMAKGDEVLTKDQKDLFEKLKRQLDKNNYKLGLYNFVASATIEARDITKEFNALSDNDDISTVIRTMNKISKYLNSYLPTLIDIRDTLQQDGTDPEIVKKVELVIAKVSLLQNSYLSTAKPIIVKVLQPFATKLEKKNGEYKETNLNLATALNYLDKDISYTQRWLDAAAEVDDDIMQITDKFVKQLKQEAHFQTLEDQKDIIGAKIELEKAGVLSADFIAERDSSGVPTGYYVGKYNRGDYDKVKADFYEDLAKRFNLEKGQKPKIGTKERKEWAAEIRRWHEENSKVKDNVQDLITQKKAEIFANAASREEAQILWDDWTARNIGHYWTADGFEEDYFRGELVEPSDMYISQSWLDIYTKEGIVRNDPKSIAKDKYYRLIRKKDEEANAKLPERFRKDPDLMPQMRKDAIERLKTSDSIVDFTRNEIKDAFLRNEGDTDFGLKATDENGVPLSFLPVYYTRKLKDPKMLTLDITTSLTAFSHMANNYSAMNKVVDFLEVESDVLRERKVGTGQFALLSHFSTKEPVVKKGEATYAYQRFQDYMSMVVYGELKKDEKDIEIFGTKLDKAKTIDAFGRYVSLNGLALNLYSGISNITFGSAMIRTEATVGEYITTKDLFYADKLYTSELGQLLGSVGTRMTDSKLALYIEYMDILQDHESNIREIDGERRTKFGQLFNTSALFFINKAGEHWMQTRMGLALANTVKLKTEDGKVINLYEAFTVENNRLKLKDGLTIVADGKTFKKPDEGKAFTQKEIIRVMNKQNFINKRLHGIYNRVDKSAIQKYALGRLALMFRKFMKPGWNRRFAKLQYNYEGETYTEGYYYTTGKFMVNLMKDIKKMQFNIGAHWNQLDDFEKKNVYRTMVEVAYMISTATLAVVLTNLKGEDDEDWFLNMMAYQVHRIYTELRFYTSPSEAFKILGSPAAGIDQAQRILDFLEFYKWGEEIDKGIYKGHTRFEKGLIETVPLVGTVNKFLSPDEQLKYYSE